MIWTARKLSLGGSVPSISDAIACLERGITVLEDKIMRLRIGFQEYYSVCGCHGALKKLAAAGATEHRTSRKPNKGPTEEYQAGDKVIQLMRRVLSREHQISAAETLASLPNTVSIQNCVSTTANYPISVGDPRHGKWSR